jgi:hypothetical protein
VPVFFHPAIAWPVPVPVSPWQIGVNTTPAPIDATGETPANGVTTVTDTFGLIAITGTSVSNCGPET